PLAHRAHVGGEIVALHDDEAKASTSIQEVGKATLGARRQIGGAIAHAGELEIVVTVKGDGVVGAPAAAHSARVDVEAEAPVGLDALVEARRADPPLVDA